jgi:hypothetical protein
MQITPLVKEFDSWFVCFISGYVEHNARTVKQKKSSMNGTFHTIVANFKLSSSLHVRKKERLAGREGFPGHLFCRAPLLRVTFTELLILANSFIMLTAIQRRTAAAEKWVGIEVT